jgi:hypothetical protein
VLGELEGIHDTDSFGLRRRIYPQISQTIFRTESFVFGVATLKFRPTLLRAIAILGALGSP